MDRVRIWILTLVVVVGLALAGCPANDAERAQMNEQFDAWLRTHAPGGKATCSPQANYIQCNVSHERWARVHQVTCDRRGCLVTQ